MMKQVRFLPRLARLLLAALGAIVLTACGGGGGGGSGGGSGSSSFAIGGKLSGLAAGQQVTLLDNGGDAITLSADGTFEFSSKVAANASYLVSVGTQPAGQVCTVGGGSGAGVTADVSSIQVVCSTQSFGIAGSLSGLAGGQSVTLLNNGSDPLTLTGNGAFSFATPVAYNGSYAVTVGTQPTGQTCTVSGGSGAGVTANVGSVSVVCSADTYTVGGTLTGLAAGQQLTLMNNGADPLTVTANGNFTFATPVAYNGSYAVTVGTQPTGQTCTVSSASGAGVTANVGGVSVVCSTNTFTIGGSVNGLAAGQQLTLLDNGGDALTLTANGNFAFATSVAFNGSYAVTVSTQPTGQTCTVGSGSGSGVSANVSNVSVVCSATTFTVGGTLSGLAAGQQVTLLDNGGDALTLTGGGNFSFATPIAFNGSYAVTVSTQPTGQTCTVGNASGAGMTANVSNVNVVCSANTYTVGGSLSGLASGQQITLLDNGGDALTLTADGNFTFATRVAYNGSYAVTVGTQPAGQTCTVSSGSGAGMTANVSSVSVTCSTNTYTIGGSVNGLAAGQQVTLMNNAGDPLTLTGDGNFSFATPVAYNGSYAVTVGTQPTGQTCTVGSGSGSGVTANVSGISVVCSTNTFTIGGSLSGLAAGQQVTLMNNGADPLTLTANGNFTFATSVAYGGSYAVTVGTQPVGQTCTVSSGSGSSVGANVGNVAVSCSTNTYTIGGTLSGLAAGQQITLLDNGGDALTLTADGNFSFATSVAYGGSYAVTIGTQPTGQTCTVASGSGSSVGANVSNVAVSCTTNTYTIGGTLTGLASGQQITLLDNGGDALTLTADGNFSFATAVAYGGSYAVTVGTQPTGQTCTVSSGSGSSVSTNVSSVAVSCTTNTYTIGGTLTGLAAGQQITLLDNGGDPLTLTANGSFSFATLVAYGGSYAVTIGTPPAGQSCTVSSGSGSGVSANVASVSVTCVSYTVGGTLSGLAAGQQVTLLDNGGDALTLTADGGFTFAAPLLANASYLVTVGTQPTGQTCSVNNGVGYGVNANITQVLVVCSGSTYTVAGTLSGLGAGQQVTLLDNGTDALTLSANGSFSFATSLAQGASYTITVGTQPAAQLCSLAENTGVGSQVTSGITTVVCAASSYGIGGTLSGLAAGQQLTLLDNSGDALTLSANGSFSFPTALPPGASYTVTVGTQPASQECWVRQGTHYPVAAAVSSILVSCESAMHVYVANVTDNTISQFTVGRDGSLSPMAPAFVATGTNPFQLAVDPAGSYLYVTILGNDTIAQYAINPDGSLGSSPVNTFATGAGPGGIAIDPQGRYLYVQSSSGTISQYTVGSGGVLSAMSTPTVNSGIDAYMIGTDSGGRYLYVGAGSGVLQYAIGSGGALSPMSPAVVSTGSLSYEVVMDPSSHYLYSGQEPAGTLAQTSIGAGGALTLLSPATVNTAVHQDNVSIDPTGRYLYAGTDSALYEFAIGSAGQLQALLSPTIASDSTAYGRQCMVDPTGRYFYCATSSGVSQYTVLSGGQLSAMSTPSVAAGASPQGLAVR